MEPNFNHEVLKKCVALISQSIGFQGMYSMPLEVMTDLLHRYLREIAVLTHRFAEHDNRTQPVLCDLSYAFHELKISLPELEEYVSSVESVPFPDALPKLPVVRPSELNLLKPGSREIVSRPIHIHDHLPPMLPDKEAGEGVSGSQESGDGLEASTTGGPVSSIQGGAKRPAEDDGASPKRIRHDDEREAASGPKTVVRSVILTTSGFISSSISGKFAEPCLPHIPLPTLPQPTAVTKTNSNRAATVTNTSVNSASALSAANRKKLSLERLMRHKQKIALNKQNSNLHGGTSATPKNKSGASKKSLSHTDVLNMAGGGMETKMGFTPKHGKSKDKLKPRIPATPPGTNHLPKIGMLKSDSTQKFINKACAIQRQSTPGLGSNPMGSLPPPKLKIPTPKMKQPEFSTDVLPLPKEDIQEQQERKLQIMKKEQKQKELALAAQRGMLGPLGGNIGSVDVSVRPVSPFVSPTGLPAEGRALLTPADHLLNKVKKERKDKEGKKFNKDVRKDKEKRDKEKRELKKKKLFKKKEEKEKRDKEKKEEKKKEKEAKKLSKDPLKKEKDGKKIKEGKKNKDGKPKDKDPMKKERKESKKVKKVVSVASSVGDLSITSDLLKPVSLVASDAGHPPLHEHPVTDGRQHLTVDVTGGLTSPIPGQTIISPPPQQDAASKSKLCIFKKNTNKTPNNSVVPMDLISTKADSNDNPFNNSLPMARALNPNLSQLTDISVDISGVLSSPSLVDTPQSIKAGRTKKRKRASLQPNLAGDTPSSISSASTNIKKRKHDTISSSPRGRSPKKSLPQTGSSSSGVVSMDDGNIMSSFGSADASPFSAGSLFNIDGRPRTPGGVDTSPNLSKCPLTPGSYLTPTPGRGGPTFSYTPPPPGQSSFIPSYHYGFPPYNTTEFGGPPLMDSQPERPLTPGSKGQQFPAVGISHVPRILDGGLSAGPPVLPSANSPQLFLDGSDHREIKDSTLELDKKKKEKEHRKEKKDKDKDKIKKKKDKKDKSEKLEKKVKEKVKKDKDKLKKDKKELKKTKKVDACPGEGNTAISVTPPQLPLQPATPKIVIKRNEASSFSESGGASSSFSVSATPPSINNSGAPLTIDSQPRSPELAKISAFITRPPKQSQQQTTKEKNSHTSCNNNLSAGSGLSILPAPMSKPLDVVSISSLKIKELKSSSKDYNCSSRSGVASSASPQPIIEQPPMQMVPPIKIKNNPMDDKSGSGKKTASVVFGSSPHRASKPTKKTSPDHDTSHSSTLPSTSIGHFVDDHGNDVWICPTCGKQDDGSPMIGCDTCDDWYHWVCVGIQVPPNEAENWYCPRCLAQHQQRSLFNTALKRDKKKHHHRKKK